MHRQSCIWNNVCMPTTLSTYHSVTPQSSITKPNLLYQLCQRTQSNDGRIAGSSQLETSSGFNRYPRIGDALHCIKWNHQAIACMYQLNDTKCKTTIYARETRGDKTNQLTQESSRYVWKKKLSKCCNDSTSGRSLCPGFRPRLLGPIGWEPPVMRVRWYGRSEAKQKPTISIRLRVRSPPKHTKNPMFVVFSVEKILCHWLGLVSCIGKYSFSPDKPEDHRCCRKDFNANKSCLPGRLQSFCNQTAKPRTPPKNCPSTQKPKLQRSRDQLAPQFHQLALRIEGKTMQHLADSHRAGDWVGTWNSRVVISHSWFISHGLKYRLWIKAAGFWWLSYYFVKQKSQSHELKKNGSSQEVPFILTKINIFRAWEESAQIASKEVHISSVRHLQTCSTLR